MKRDRRAYSAAYYASNKKKRLSYLASHKDEVMSYHAAYRETHKEDLRTYRDAHKEEKKVYNATYWKSYSPEKLLAHKESKRAYDAAYRAANRQKLRAHECNRRKTDPNFRLKKALRARVLGALNGTSKSASTISLLGCSIEHLWAHLESRFQPGMTRENHGDWHVDHIKPCSSFDLTDPAQQIACFHWSNLQPLWKLDNLRKGSKLCKKQEDGCY